MLIILLTFNYVFAELYLQKDILIFGCYSFALHYVISYPEDNNMFN